MFLLHSSWYHFSSFFYISFVGNVFIFGHPHFKDSWAPRNKDISNNVRRHVAPSIGGRCCHHSAARSQRTWMSMISNPVKHVVSLKARLHMTQVNYQLLHIIIIILQYLLWIVSKTSISAKRHWNALVANKMRCPFCHRVSRGCWGWISTWTWHTTGCTAVFLFQAHHALPRKPVLPETKHERGILGRILGRICGSLVVYLTSFLQQYQLFA